MRYGIAGNVTKADIWEPVAEVAAWLLAQGLPLCLHREVADGLQERELLAEEICAGRTTDQLGRDADVVLSFGGDGTLLRTAHELGDSETPILGVNVGHLGFLAVAEIDRVRAAIEMVERDEHTIERRLTLAAEAEDGIELPLPWALNEYVVDRSGPAGLIRIEVALNGKPLNTYWADGLIVATATGSTAYALAVGGPIVTPESEVIVLAPVAPHSLTVRPLILPATSHVEVSVGSDKAPYIVAADGVSTEIGRRPMTLRIRRAEHVVRLVRLPDQDFFETLRTKLMWGKRSGRRGKVG